MQPCASHRSFDLLGVIVCVMTRCDDAYACDACHMHARIDSLQVRPSFTHMHAFIGIEAADAAMYVHDTTSIMQLHAHLCSLAYELTFKHKFTIYQFMINLQFMCVYVV